jgi:hypothetical protein
MPISVSGTSIVFNDATTQTTAFTGGAGTVTSVATGNGLQGGTITSTGTLSVACPAFNTVGSYCQAGNLIGFNVTFLSGSNYAAGISANQISCTGLRLGGASGVTVDGFNNASLSGTWKWMAANFSGDTFAFGLACRVS